MFIKPYQQDRLLPEHTFAHTNVYAKPWSCTVRKELTPIQGNGWNMFTCGDEEEYTMHLHHPSSLLLQSYRRRHTRGAFKVSSEEGCAASCQGAGKYNHRGIDLQHLFLGMTAEGHCTAGLEMGAQCVSPVKYLLQFTEGHFFLSGNVICDLINK